jgi:1,4-dihydroxy-2-naphthoate polyprenyltransferase
MDRKSILLFIQLSRPMFLLGGVLLYALGVGLAHYLGARINWNVYFLGQAWVTMLQLSTQYFNEYFNSPADSSNPNRTPFTGGSGALGPGKLPRSTALYAGLLCLGVVASLTAILLGAGAVTPLAMAIMVTAFLGSFFYSVPPVRLESSGYGELTTSILVAFLLPAFAYTLQTGEMHRFLPMVSLPLVLLHISMLIAFNLPDYGNDMKFEKRTLLVRIGWERAMFLHNVLILLGFLLVGVAMLNGLPFFIAMPAMFALPLGVLQIWQMRRIAAGIKPNWTALTLNGLAVFVVTAYLVTYAFWTH